MSLVNNLPRYIKIIAITIIIMTGLVAILGVWGAFSVDSVINAVYTMLVVLACVVLINALSNHFLSSNSDTLGYVLKIVALGSIVVFSLISILAIRSIFPDEFVRKSLTSAGLIFGVSLAINIIAKMTHIEKKSK